MGIQPLKHWHILEVTSEGEVFPNLNTACNGKAFIFATIIDPNFTQSPDMDPDLSCSDSNHPCLGGVTGRILIGVSIPAWKEKDVTCHLNFPKVWSMTSLPVMPYNPTLEVIFPDAVIVYEYQKGIGYVRVTGEKELEAGRGY